MVAISKPSQIIKQRVTVGDDVHRIECPALIVHGTEDFIVFEAPELAQRLISHARLVFIRQSCHCPFIERPEASTQALRSLIDTSPTG